MISIIIPALNEEDTIRKTVEQFQSLSLPHEIIVADGGSRDSTVKIAREVASKVIVHSGHKPQTIGGNRNNGGKVAMGEYLVFLDSDCVIFGINDFFELALRDFESDKKLAALTSGIYILPEVATFMDRIVCSAMTFNFVVLNNFLHLGIALGKFQMMRREVFERVGGFREDIAAAEDMDMFTRIAKIGSTRIDTRLRVYHSGRRAHAIGWPKLLFTGWMDAASLWVRGKVISKNWYRKD